MDSPSLSQSSYSQPLPPTITHWLLISSKSYYFLKNLKEKKNTTLPLSAFSGNINIEILGNVGLRLDGKEPAHQSDWWSLQLQKHLNSIPEKKSNRLLTIQLTQLFTLFHRTETEIRNSEFDLHKAPGPGGRMCMRTDAAPPWGVESTIHCDAAAVHAV